MDCWLLSERRRETAADQGLCADAFARTPEPQPESAGQPLALPANLAALPEAPPVSGPVAVPSRKPRVPTLRSRATVRSGHHVTRASAAGAAGSYGDGDFFGNLKRDLGRLGDLFGGSSTATGRRPAADSHLSHQH